MSSSAELFVEKVNQAFPDAIIEIVDFRDERTLVIEQEHLKKVCFLLRDDEELVCNYLEDIVADDMLPEFPRFAVNYHIYSISKNHYIRLRVPVEDPDDGPESVGPVWPIGTWLEMEVWDLMGITFQGHPDHRRILLGHTVPIGGGPPSRPDPCGVEEVLCPPRDAV